MLVSYSSSSAGQNEHLRLRMESKWSNLPPLKRRNDALDTNRSKKPRPNIVTGFRKLKILLPNGMTVLVKLSESLEFIYVKELVKKVKDQYHRIFESERGVSTRRRVNWDGKGVCFVDDYDNELKNKLKLSKLRLDHVYNLRLDDGSKPADIYENMWDLTPDTELFMELPEEYTLETLLANLIDNSLQAVWSNDQNDRRLIRVEVSDEKISIADTGPGMDYTSIEKWGKMGASLNRVHKTQGIGGKPPYLKPAFGMFGYGGFIASMHLGRHTEVSSKTKNSRKVYTLRLQRDALLRGSGSKQTWRTSGSVRDPTCDELKLSPGGNFTKIDIYEPKMKKIDIRRLKCILKDIYFPYIQCDELSKGKTILPIEFQVNGDNLAEFPGGEIAITNLNSCKGPEFVLQLRFELNHDIAATTSSQGSRSSNEANARLRCVYLPVKEGKDTIGTILETLKKDGLGYVEEVGSFSHASCRRLGRLLPDARWAWIPFMDFRQRTGEKLQILQRICKRTDAGFDPTPFKTDFAHKNPYTTALRNLGSKPPLEKEIGVRVDMRRDGKSLTPVLLDKQYRQWLLDMHDRYDEEAEADCGTDDPVLVRNHTHKKELHISSNVARIHKSARWKGKSWISGQRIKILKGACAGFQGNVYATLEYILLEGLQGDTGGKAWIICRTIDVLEENGSVLNSVDGNPNFDLRKSVSIPMNVIDSGKFLAVDDIEWIDQLDKQNQKVPSSIEMLTSTQCRELGIESVPDGPEFHACNLSHCEVVAVVRPANYKSQTPAEPLEQKFVIKDNFQMLLAITYSKSKTSRDENIYSGRVTPSSRNKLNGLYIFQPKCKSHPLFRRAGVYTFTFFIKDSSCAKCVVNVRVKGLSEVHRWALTKNIPHHNLRVSCRSEPISVSIFDKYGNQLPFLEEPKLVIKIKPTNGTMDSIQIKQWNQSISLDRSALKIEDLLIESFTLDKLRPSYDATMMLCLQDGSPLLDIRTKVLPGPIKRFTVQPENFEKNLIPGQVIKELILELFDAYGNHVQENEKVELSMIGFGWVDRSTSVKVDAYGCVNLGGLLRVGAGYGSTVSLSVSSADRVVTTKEWQIDKRKLTASTVWSDPKTAALAQPLTSQSKSFEIERANEIQSSLPSELPSFVKLMVPSNVTGCFWLGIPKSFCDAHLPKDDVTVVLVDEDDQEYNTKYLDRKTGFSGGWRGFSIAHKLLAGDALVFQLIDQWKMKVYIVRASGLNEIDGGLSVQNLASCDMNVYNTEYADPPVSEGLRFSQSVIEFKDIKGVDDFSIVVDNLVIDSEIPKHFQTKYYDLCRSQNMYLHENLLKGLNVKLAVGIILETITIADAIQACQVTITRDDIATWDKTLKAFEEIGMKVGFLRARISKLKGLLFESKELLEAKKLEQTKAEEEMRIIKEKLLNLDVEMETLKLRGQKLEQVFQKVANAPW